MALPAEYDIVGAEFLKGFLYALSRRNGYGCILFSAHLWSGFSELFVMIAVLKGHVFDFHGQKLAVLLKMFKHLSGSERMYMNLDGRTVFKRHHRISDRI